MDWRGDGRGKCQRREGELSGGGNVRETCPGVCPEGNVQLPHGDKQRDTILVACLFLARLPGNGFLAIVVMFSIRTRSSATAEIARVTIKSVIAVGRLSITVTLNMIYKLYFTNRVVNTWNYATSYVS